MGDPAVILCGFCAQRSPVAPTVESIWLESCLPHSLGCGNLSCPPASNHPLEVVRQRHRFAAGVLALCLGDGNALVLTLKNILTLELCNCRKYGEHKLAGRRSRVDGLFAADKLYMLFGQPFHGIKQVACSSQSG